MVIITEGTYLERKFLQEDNNTLNIMKILPTLKFHYKEVKRGLRTTHENVEIKNAHLVRTMDCSPLDIMFYQINVNMDKRR